MRHGFEAITIKIETEDKRALERRCLEHPGYGRWNGPKTYADLVRQAIKAFLAGPGEAKQQAAIGKQLEGKTPQRLAPVFVHRYRASASASESICGIRGLAEDATTNIAEDVTCPQCKTIQHANARAFLASAITDADDAIRGSGKYAPKKAAKKRAAKKASKRGARR